MRKSARNGGRGTGEAPCAFAKALLARCADCPLARRIAIAESESVTCACAEAAARCVALRDRLRAVTAFALRAPEGVALAHAAQLRLQCGGLAGLAAAIGGSSGDVAALAAKALGTEGAEKPFPADAIVRAVQGWSVRRSR